MKRKRKNEKGKSTRKKSEVKGLCHKLFPFSLPFFLFPFAFFLLTGCAGFGKFTGKEELGFERLKEVPLQEVQTPQETLKVGEKLTYSVRWMGIEVGTAQLEVKGIIDWQGHQVYDVVTTTHSNRFLSVFYRVEDEIHSYIDVKGLFPWRFAKNQQEGHYRANEEMIYDQEKGTATYRSFRNNSVKQMEIPQRVQDSLSVLYFFRTQPLEVGKSVFIPVNADEKNWNLEIQVLKLGLLEGLPVGRRAAILTEPLAKFHGVFVRKGRVWIWFDTKSHRAPLLMRARLPFGLVEVVLVKESYGDSVR